MTPLFKSLDFSNITGRVLIAGDVHGERDILDEALKSIGFHPKADRLIFLGDLIDRGPDSAAMADLTGLSVYSIRGNHEDMFIRAVLEDDERMQQGLLQNGGHWTLGLSEHERTAQAKHYAAMPYALEIKTPGGRTIGCVHADVPGGDWTAFKAALLAKDTPLRRKVLDAAIWSRERIQVIRGAFDRDDIPGIPGIDHVFFGHTILPQPTVHKNMSYLDTGAFLSGKLTIVDADDWIASNMPADEMVVG